MSSNYFNHDTEVAILSIIINNPSSIFEVPDLKSDFFSSYANKCLFDTIQNLVHTGIGLEYNLLLSYLESSNKLMDCGGKDYLDYLIKQEYNPENLRDFEKILIDSFKARVILSLSGRIPDIMKSQGGIDSVISYIRDSINGISDLSSDFKTISLLDASKETWEHIVKRAKDPNKIELSTGFSHLDSITGGYEAGQMWMIAGRPGMGKSAWMVNSAVRTGALGIPTLLFSKEMHRISLVTRMISIVSKIPIYNIRLGLVNSKDLELIAETITTIKDYPIYIDTNFTGNPNYIESTIRRYKELYGVKLVHLDYVQLVAERGDDATHELGRISRMLKLLAEEIEVVNIVYSQLNRKLEDRPDKRPMLADLRQSGNLEEDPDIVMFLYRDEVYNKDNSRLKGKMENIIAKQRNGPIGTIMSQFDADTNIISEDK